MTLKHLFSLPNDIVYLCGHSLGPMPKMAALCLQEGLHHWEQNLVGAWHDWIDLPKQLGSKIALLIGSSPNEVIVCDSTSINLMKLLLSAIPLNPNRNIILTEQGNFPADLYIADSVACLQNKTVKAVSPDAIVEAMDEQVAVLMLTHVNYRTSFKYDMAKINRKAKALGILTLWDLSHSVGIMPLDCSKFEVDFAVGCTYKYLNGGPGAPSFLYVHQKHLNQIPAIRGWMGHKTPFTFSPHYESANGITAYLTGTPNILSMKALEGALHVFEKVDLAALQEKSTALSSYLIAQCQQYLPDLMLASPFSSAQRGSHVAFSHPHAYAISRAMIAKGVIMDYREPNLMRFGLSPLYVDFADIEKTMEIFREVVQKKLYDLPHFEKKLKVT
jgi:kynureninase